MYHPQEFVRYCTAVLNGNDPQNFGQEVVVGMMFDLIQKITEVASRPEQDQSNYDALMHRLIKTGPDISLTDHGDVTLLGAFLNHGRLYLPMLLYHGRNAYAYVASRLRSMIIGLVDQQGGHCDHELDQAFITKLRALPIDVASEAATLTAETIFKECEAYFNCLAYTEEDSPLSQGIAQSMTASSDEELIALLSLRNATSVSFEAQFTNTMWSPPYFSALCQAWKVHRPDYQAFFCRGKSLPNDVCRLIASTFSIDELMNLSLLSFEAARFARVCLYPMVIYQSVKNLYLDTPEKARMMNVRDNAPSLRLQGFLLAVKLTRDFREHRYFLLFANIILNRSFPSLAEYEHLSERYTAFDPVHSNLLLVAALLGRIEHFEALLTSGFGQRDLFSDRLVFHLADRGQLCLLERLESEQRIVDWAGRGRVIAYREVGNKLLPQEARLLPGETIEHTLPSFCRPEYAVVRHLPCSPIVASLRRRHREVALFLAQKNVVKPTLEMVQLAHQRGYEDVKQALIDRVHVEDPLRAQLLAKKLIDDNRDIENYKIIEAMIFRLIDCIVQAKKVHLANTSATRKVLRWRQGTLRESDVLYPLIDALPNEDDHESQESCLQAVCNLLTHEALCIDDVPGSGLMRYIIDAIHNNTQLVAMINLHLFPDQRVLHSELFNDSPYVIPLTMPPKEAVAVNGKFSVEYRTFYARYLRATVRVWLTFIHENHDRLVAELNREYLDQLRARYGGDMN